MSFADQYLNKEKVSDNTEAVIELLDIVSNRESKFNLTEAQLANVKSLKAKCSFQVKPLTEIYRERLWNAWKAYEDPSMTLMTAITTHEQNKISDIQAREKTVKDGDKGAAATSSVPPRDFHETIVEINNAQYIIDPKTGVNHPKPLLYSKKLEWIDFMDEVHLNPYSGTVDLYKSILNLMTECARVGCDRDQLCKIYKEFVFHHMQESYNSLSYENDAETIFDILMGMLDISSHLTKMKECLRMIKRRPHEGIQKPIRAYQSLITEVLSIQSPSSTEKENREQAMKEACKAVKFFTTKAVWTELQRWKEKFKHKNNRFAMLSEIIDFTNDCESKPGNKPSSTLTLDNQEVRIDLFLSDTQHTWSCQFGQEQYEEYDEEDDDEYDEEDLEEVHTSELSDMGPRYANLPSTPHSLYGNEAPTVAAHDRKTRQQPGTLYPGTARWGEHGHVSPKKKAGKGKTKSSFPFRPSSTQGTIRGSGQKSSDRRSRPTQRGSAASAPAAPYSPASPSHPRSGGSSPAGGKSPKPQSPAKPRSGNSSTESVNRKGRSAERKEIFDRTQRTPSRGRCWICWTRHPDGKCDYGKIKAAQIMCRCGYGYHPKNVCLTPSVDNSTHQKSQEKLASKATHPFMPKADKTHPN